MRALLARAVVEQVMTIASHSTALRRGAVSPIERVLLKKLPAAVKSGHGAMSFRMANYEERASRTGVYGILRYLCGI